jgi:hypothetical protein
MGNAPGIAYSKNCCEFVMLSLIFSVFCIARPVFSAPHDAKTKPPQAALSARPCPPVVASAKSAKSMKRPSKIPADASEGGVDACLEVRATPIEIREFLQSLAREQRWTPRQQQTSSDLWTFVRRLEKGELSLYAKTDILAGRVTWTEGKALVSVEMEQTADALTRIEIKARFHGRGQTSLPLARPTDWWPLVSRVTLEDSMIAALEGHFGLGH